MPDTKVAPDFYTSDFAAWAEQQTREIRELGRLGRLNFDWEHVAEEIEGLTAALKRELGSRIATIIEHLIKLENSTAEALRDGWIETIQRSRDEIERILDDNPSLEGEIPIRLGQELPRARRAAARSLAKYQEVMSSALYNYTTEQVLGDWLPEPPAS